MMKQDWKDGAALLIMRLGLAWFILLWAAHKIITPKQYQNLARHFDGVDVSFAQIYGMAAFQITVCVLVALGLFRIFSYSALLVMHFFTVTRRWEKFLGAMIALILLIRRDHLSIGGWLSRQRSPKWWF